MTPDVAAIMSELEHGRQDERTERDERRGLEARASALLAAGAAVIGLVATALRDINVTGAERDRLLTTVAVATLIMAVAIGLTAWALTRRQISGGHRDQGEDRAHTWEDVQNQWKYVETIREKNRDMLRWLKRGTWAFGVALAFFLATVLWAAWAAAPSSPTPITVHVSAPAGPPGPQGPRGYRGLGLPDSSHG
jgi:hypothetical protein